LHVDAFKVTPSHSLAIHINRKNITVKKEKARIQQVDAGESFWAVARRRLVAPFSRKQGFGFEIHGPSPHPLPQADKWDRATSQQAG